MSENIWTSKTRQFGEEEMLLLQQGTSDVNDLAVGLMASDSIVALRGVAEVMLNEGEESLTLQHLLANENLNRHWARFTLDWGVNKNDLEYVSSLLKLAAKFNPEVGAKLKKELQGNLVVFLKQTGKAQKPENGLVCWLRMLWAKLWTKNRP